MSRGDVASQWVTGDVAQSLTDELYCKTRDVFTVRLESFLSRIEKEMGEDAYLVIAVVGEIGNNSFDHNLGNWPDVPGVYFAQDVATKTVILADRGLGVKKTIGRIIPAVTDDEEALTIAFTKVLSGRAPERRGNGLKFVARVVREKRWSLTFQSGNAELIIKPDTSLASHEFEVKIHGTLAILNY